MRIERINENMIKVTISLNDLEERNIDLESINYNSPAAQELFWDMMEQAEIELDFAISDSQLIIEPVPDEEEGFIVTVTKLNDEEEFESIHKYIKNRFHRADIRVKKIKKLSPAVWIYRFDNFDNLCLLAKKLEKLYMGKTSLYEYNENYFLVMRKDGFFSLDMVMTETLLAEYGHRVRSIAFTEGYLNEYGRIVLRSNCLETLRDYF